MKKKNKKKSLVDNNQILEQTINKIIDDVYVDPVKTKGSFKSSVLESIKKDIEILNYPDNVEIKPEFENWGIHIFKIYGSMIYQQLAEQIPFTDSLFQKLDELIYGDFGVEWDEYQRKQETPE